LFGLAIIWLKRFTVKYVIGDSDLERVDVIIDLGVLIDSRVTFVNHIELILSKSARMLGFIKRISREFNELYVAFVRPGLEFASCVWSPHQKICIARSGLDCSASASL
jgi:hypothetical protein